MIFFKEKKSNKYLCVSYSFDLKACLNFVPQNIQDYYVHV